MDMSKYRPESHVAQQSLREKLRVQQSSNLVHQLENFPSSLEHGSSVHSGLNPDFVQVQNVRNDNLVYDPDVFSTGIFHVLPQSVESQHNCDWMAGYPRENNQDPSFVAEVMSNNGRETNLSAATQYLKPSYSAVHDAQSNPGLEVYSLEGKRDYGNLHFVSHSLYQNALQDVVGLEVGSHEHQNVRETARGSRMDYFGNEANAVHFGNDDAWMNRPLVEHSQHLGGELGFLPSKSDATAHQGLSLSLSSNPIPKICGADAVQFVEGQQQHGEFKELQESKALKPSVTGKANGKSLQETSGTSSVHRQMIPLGPFTGYSTILKNSRFLKPAQDLLDELCQSNNSKSVKACDASEGISDGSDSPDAPNAVDMETGPSKGNNSGASSSTFYSSNDSCRPEYQQKKAKLVYMQDEVCRRYMLYHQQMQMVVSSFESVAGLGAATPYFSSALKTVARNFRCMQNAILDQIRHICRALGEDLLSSTTGTSSSKGDINMPRMKYAGQKSGGVNMGLHEPQQLGWRPQRGLPERSVAILRAWLFEHFLHPYPTDTDKHMLATQTGLSRNQVSNWFINARVRVWKPMVEEIHMLESKGLAEGNLNMSKSDGKSTCEGHSSWPKEDQSISRSCVNPLSDKHLLVSGDVHDVEPWNHEKRSRMDFRIPTSMDGSLMSFAPYQPSRFDNGGLGAVSLTLGLRHGVESVQQQQQQQQQQYNQQQEHHLRRQFGGHLIHDFVG